MLDGKPQFRREAEGPQDTEGVFGKALERVADRAKPTVSDVVEPSEGVENAARGMKGHGVDAEVASRKIVFYIVGECYGVGMPRIAVRPVDAVGRHLEGDGFDQDGHRAVLRPRLDDAMAGSLEKELVSCQGAQVAMS